MREGRGRRKGSVRMEGGRKEERRRYVREGGGAGKCREQGKERKGGEREGREGGRGGEENKICH